MVNVIGSPDMVPLMGEATDSGETLTPRMSAKAILQCRPNSHPFPDRTLLLDQPVKVGRSVARARPARNNAIFDCKVLSRNHALLWYENGKFFLQDTRSSNGTFVNNQRLSKGSEESAPREVCSGDVVQYGVDVMENSRKVTHGCIIATLKLFMPDGQEAKASSFITTGDGSVNISAQDFLHLKTCIHEAQHRENLIETKLATLQLLLDNTEKVAGKSWSAMIEEDRLLQRLENVEGQLLTYVKTIPEDTSREEVKRILQEKDRYETTAKQALERILKDKTELLSKCAELERVISNSKAELTFMNQVADTAQKDLEELLVQQSAQNLEIEDMSDKIKAAEEKLDDTKANNDSDKKDLEEQMKEQERLRENLLIQIESLKAENDFTKEQLSSIKAKYENIKNGKLNLSNILALTDASNLDIEDSEVEKNLRMFRSAVQSLQDRLWQAQEEHHQTQANITQLKNETEIADKVESKTSAQRLHLLDEMSEKKNKEEGNVVLINHLQSQLGILESRLRNIDPETPKIYDDIYEDNTVTLERYKKTLKEENNKDEENEKVNDDEDAKSDTTIMNEIVDKNNLNGTDLGIFQFDSDSLMYLKDDIIKIQEILHLAETSKSSAEEELRRIRDEFGQATTSSVTAAHEAASLHHQLAASEAIFLEKTRYVSTLQEVSGQLESSLELIYSHISVLTHRVSKEKEETLNAKNQTEDFRRKLEEAEILCKENVQEAEKLHIKINTLEETVSSPIIISPEIKSSQQETDSLSSDTTDTLHTHNDKQGTNHHLTTDTPVEELVDPTDELIPQLNSEIDRLKKAYDDLKEKETKLCQQISTSVPESPIKIEADTFFKDQRNDDEILLKLKDELRNLNNEHKRLQEKLIISDGMFTELNLQNKMTIPTWMLFLIVAAIALGWDWLTSLF